MTDAIHKLIESQGLLICPACDGEGSYESFAGHVSMETCCMCEGHGVVKSLNLQEKRKTCIICKGRKDGCGGCDYIGYHEYKTYELIK